MLRPPIKDLFLHFVFFFAICSLQFVSGGFGFRPVLAIAKGSRQQHLLLERESRATACWGTNVACHGEVGGWWDDYVLVIKGDRVLLGVRRLAVT